MTFALSDVPREMTSRPFPSESPQNHLVPALTKEELDGVLRELAVPFAANLVQWRVIERSDDGARGLMMPYADPRAYSDRLNWSVYPCRLDAQVHGASQRPSSAQ